MSKVGWVTSVLTSLLVLSLVPAIGTTTVYVTTAQEVKTDDVVNTSLLLAKANTLRLMLNNSLNLNLSEGSKQLIKVLLGVDLKNLTVGEVRAWIQNAVQVLARIEEEVRAGKAYAVGIVLQRYLNGLSEAVENRVKVIARRYNVTVSVDDVLANLTRARDIAEVSKHLNEFRRRLMELEVVRAREFAENVRRLAEEKVEALRRGAVVGIEDVAKNLDMYLRVLEGVTDRLRVVNASEDSLRSVGRAVESVKAVKELLTSVAEGVRGRRPSVEEFEEVLNTSIQSMIAALNVTIARVENELQFLRSLAEQYNLREYIAILDKLLARITNLRNTLNNVVTAKEFKGLLDDVANIGMVMKHIEDELENLTKAILERLGGRVKDIASRNIEEAENTLKEVEELLIKVLNKSRIVCIQIYPPPPICRVIGSIAKTIPLIEKRVNEAKELIMLAREYYNNGNYTKALNLSTKALALLEAAKQQLTTMLKLLEDLERSPTPPVQPRR